MREKVRTARRGGERMDWVTILIAAGTILKELLDDDGKGH